MAYDRNHVLTLQDLQTIPAANVWAEVDEAYNALTNPFRAAGVVKQDPLLQSRALGESATTNIHMWDALPYQESNVSNDDPTQHAQPLKLNDKKWTAVRRHANIGFSQMDLVVDLLAQDPLASLGNRIAVYKNNDEVTEMFAILNGLVASDKANGSKITTSQATKKFDLVQALTGIAKLGDASSQITTLGMDMETYLQLQIQQINGFVPSAQTNTAFGTFAGRNIIVDDRFVGAKVGGKDVKRIYGMGADLIHVGSAPAPVNSVEVERDASAGNGRGQSTMWFRWQNIVHPVGYSFEGNYASVGGPTFAELSAAGAFVRNTSERKIPLVVIEAPLADAA